MCLIQSAEPEYIKISDAVTEFSLSKYFLDDFIKKGTIYRVPKTKLILKEDIIENLKKMKLFEIPDGWISIHTLSKNHNIPLGNLKNAIKQKFIKCKKIQRGKIVRTLVNKAEVESKIETIKKIDKYYLRTVTAFRKNKKPVTTKEGLYCLRFYNFVPCCAVEDCKFREKFKCE